MANLKVFISSTCYDLGVIRSQLRNFLGTQGFEAVMSDHSDILFDPRVHTHTSCVQEVVNCDMSIVIIGSRFGGRAIPKSVDAVDVDKLKVLSTGQLGNDNNCFSVTQLEVLRSIQEGIPIFTFIDAGVLHDHLTYEKNKHKAILSEIEFPSIEKQDTASYIFEFINFLRLRAENNSIIGFSKLEDIETHLRKQWSGLFQRLLSEQRFRKSEEQRIDYLSSQIADLKTAIVTSISSEDLRETARGAIKFRSMIEFVAALPVGPADVTALLLSEKSWGDVLEEFDIKDIQQEGSGPRMLGRAILVRSDGTYYRTQASLSLVAKLATRWAEFCQIPQLSRRAIVNAILDNADIRSMPSVRYVAEQYSPADQSATINTTTHIFEFKTSEFVPVGDLAEVDVKPKN